MPALRPRPAVLARAARAVRVGAATRATAVRRWRPGRPVVAAVALTTVAPLAVAGAVVLVPTHHARPLAAAPLPVLTPTPTDTPSPAPSIAAAITAPAASRPAASAPVKRLPVVRAEALHVGGIPQAALSAYVTAARRVDSAVRGCHLHWWLLAGIGWVESGHAANGGSENPRWDGIARPPIYGPTLDGSNGFAAVPDTDGGRLDGDPHWDRAVGPMQFIPSTWMVYGRVGPGGALADPQDVRAAALAAASYLCSTGLDLGRPLNMAGAVYAYNHSFDYVRLVLTVGGRYAGITPDQLGVPQLPHDQPAAAPGPSPSVTPTPMPTASGRPAKPTPAPAASRRPAPAPAPAASTGPGSGQAPSPSHSPSPSPRPSPSPSGGQPLPPLPTPTVGVGGLR